MARVNRVNRVALVVGIAIAVPLVIFLALGFGHDPETIDSPHSGLPAGRDQANPPALAKPEPYKTHLAYVKERRTDDEAEQLLDEALHKLRERRGQD